jgi:lysine 2,3-aminomutase
MTTQSNWTRELSKGLIKPKQLVDHNIISEDESESFSEINKIFDMRVPKIFLEHIKQDNHPLKKQFIPDSKELVFLPEELTDPIGDETFSPVEGLTHRYKNRVLLKPTYMCASYCRFCFRRYKVSNSENNLTNENYIKCLEYIKNHEEIWEVILTGGDPLVLRDQQLGKIMNDLSEIEHVKIVRFHSRIPSVLPQRITPELIKTLKDSKKTIWFSAHINHADEFTAECKHALGVLTNSGIPVVMQSVLLKGVNDSFEALKALFETAVENNVRPYYLHYPDLAKGTHHFRMPLDDAQKLFATLRGKLSGLCIPVFVLDIPGGLGKISAEKSRIWQHSDGSWQLDSPLKK